MAAEHVAVMPLVLQPLFPDHCFSCRASSPKQVVKIAVQPEFGDFVVHNVTPWWMFMKPVRTDITLRVPTCDRCQVRMNRARSTQFFGMLSGIALTILAVCLSSIGGSAWAAVAVACVGATAFATTVVAWIWEGAKVPLLVSASFRGASLRLKFDDLRDQDEFERLNGLKDGMGAG